MCKLLEIISKQVNLYYSIPGNECGGNLHILLDDGNIDDIDIDICEKQAIEENDDFGAHICRLMKNLTMKERQQICG